MVIAFFGISRAHFHSTVRRKVAIRMQGDASCPSGIAMLNRAMCGRRMQHNALIRTYCERTMVKLDYNIGVFNPSLYKHLVKDVSALRHGDDFATFATHSDRGMQGILEQTYTLETHCIIGSATTAL